MNSSLVNISNFLIDDNIKRINIPIYQRSYEWKKEHIDQFLEDLEILLKDKKKDAYQFLGMIVYVGKEDADKEIEIIDGQQRITSYLLFCVLVHDWLHYETIRPDWSGRFDSNQLELMKRYKYDLSNIIYTSDSIRSRDLTKKSFYQSRMYTENTYKKDAEMTEYLLMDFKKVLIELENDKRKSDENSNPHTVRNRLFNPEKGKKSIIKDLHLKTAKSRPVFKNQNIFAKWFKDNIGSIENKDKRCKEIEELIEALTKKIKIIPFQTEDHIEAFTLFEVLNDRGLQVSQADLLKNLCIRRGKNKQEKRNIYDSWQEVIDEKLTENNKIAFLRTSYNSKDDFIRKKEVYKSYKKIIDSMDFEELSKYIEINLKEDVLNYNVCILDSNENNKDLPENLRKYISLLYHTDTVQWRSIALSVLRKIKSADHKAQEKLVNIISEVFEIIFTLVANDERFNKIETEFPEYAKQISDSESFDLILSSIKKFKNSEKLSYKDAKIDIKDFESNKFCALFLLMYRYDKDLLSIDNKKFTVEHVLPQKAKPKDWLSLYPGLFSNDNDILEETRNNSIYNIGNMILVEDKQNKSLGNLSWAKKKKKLLDNKIVDIIESKSNFNYTKVDKWNFDVIDNRFDEIKKGISKTFNGLKF
jgi:uncharacterized protein with ParB-like and HNH nuclease domain